jgi:hypothetical protein
MGPYTVKKGWNGNGKTANLFYSVCGADLTSPYLIVDYEVQPFTPTTTTVSPINQKWNNQ